MDGGSQRRGIASPQCGRDAGVERGRALVRPAGSVAAVTGGAVGQDEDPPPVFVVGGGERRRAAAETELEHPGRRPGTATTEQGEASGSGGRSDTGRGVDAARSGRAQCRLPAVAAA